MLSNYSKRSFIFYITGNVEDKQGNLQYLLKYTLWFNNLSSTTFEYLKQKFQISDNATVCILDIDTIPLYVALLHV